MTYVLNNADVLPVSGITKTVAPASSAPTFRQRLFAAIVESRRRSAARELRARYYLINEAEVVLGGFPTATISNDVALPFNR
jgi:hypothetical protein